MSSYTLLAIKNAVACGYRVDLETGIIYGLSKRPLRLNQRKAITYPHVTLTVKGMPRRTYSVAAHKLVAFVVFGDDAFKPGIHVRHLNGNRLDLRAENLALGTPTVNAMDKPPEVRRAIARIARAAQGSAAWNRKFSQYEVRRIRKQLARGVGVTALARSYDVHHSTITRIAQRKSYAERKSS